MATVDQPRTGKRRARRPNYEQAGEPQKKSHAFRNGSIAMLLLLVTGIYFAPAIVAHTPLKDSLLARALQLNGSASLGSVSLGWFSSVVANDVRIRDANDEPVVEIGQLRTEKSLVGLIAGMGNVGLVEVDRLKVHAVCNEQDTNLEQVFAHVIEVEEESPARVTMQLKINDGAVTIDDVPSGRTFQLEKLSVDLSVSDQAQPLALIAAAALADDPAGGRFDINLVTERSADHETALASGKIDCQATALPLELSAPVLRRLMAGSKAGGRLTTKLNGAWGTLAEGGEATISGETLVTDLAFSANALGQDVIELDRVEMPCRLVQTGETLKVESLGVRCELGEVSLSGSAKMADVTDPDRWTALARENYKLQGQLDLVKLAAVLPETLRIREGTEITSGKIHLAVASRKSAGGTSWNGQLDASHLGAKADGRTLVWENPLALHVIARENESGLTVESAECTSSFLHAKASGTLDNFTASASFDLARLLSELKQFADLSELHIAGQGDAKLAVKRSDKNEFTANGQLQAKGFQFVPVAGGRPWKEENVLAKLDVSGKFDGPTLQRIDTANMTVDIGSEKLTAQLNQAVTAPSTADWPLQGTWRGNLAQWTPRLEACLGMTGWDLRGAGNLQFIATYSPKNLEVELAKADFTQLQITGHDWFIHEPTVAIACEGLWEFASQRGEIAEAKLTAGNTSAVVTKALVQRTADGMKVDGGTAHVAAELASLYRWRHDPRTPNVWQVSGRLTADADLKHAGGTTTAKVDGAIDQLQVAELAPAKPGQAPAAWRERRITLAGLGNLNHASEKLRLEKMQIASDALKLDASGIVPLAAAGGDVDVKGTIQYDWQQLAPLWKPYLGDTAMITGRQARNFAVAGHLSGAPLLADSWKQVTGDAAVGWAGMSVHGFQIGQGDIVARLADGQVRTAPIDVAVSDGRFTFAPVVRLTPGPAELYVPRGPLLTNIHLSPEMCGRGLKFIAPIVAETTVAEGRFSVTMDGGRVPLADPKTADFSGKMAIRAQVKPGPVAEEFMVLLNELASIFKNGSLLGNSQQAGALMSIDTNDIEFRMVGGRVYHRNLKFTVGTLPITTYGSVGMDESLSMVAEIPLRANLLGRDLSLGNMEGQSLQIRIDGTLKKPKLNRGALRDITGQLLQNAARGVIVDEVGKRLEQLFPLQRGPQ